MDMTFDSGATEAGPKTIAPPKPRGCGAALTDGQMRPGPQKVKKNAEMS